MEILIKHGANVDSKDQDGGTPLSAAVSKGYSQNKSLDIGMLETNTNNLSLFIYLGHYKIAELLIKNGANFDVAGKDGKTLLHLASESGEPADE